MKPDTENIFDSEIVKPQRDNLEVVVFGSGFGESILIHLPFKGWCVIDSCISNTSKGSFCLPLEYLKALGVKELYLVLLTHPHRDHYLGMDKIITDYFGKIKILARYDGDGLREYKHYLELRKQVTKSESPLTAIFKKFEDGVKTGNARPMRILESTLIMDEKAEDRESTVKIFAISPSASCIKKYQDYFFANIPSANQKLPNVDDKYHNLLSVALLVQYGETKIILGSDVEHFPNNLGWPEIHKNFKESLPIKLLKVSHHGSKNSFHKPTWDEHVLNGKIFSIVTPYRYGNTILPQAHQVDVISSYSNYYAQTSLISIKNPKKIYGHKLVKRLNQRLKSLKVFDYSKKPGFVRVILDNKNTILDHSFVSPGSVVASPSV